jgi:hypothetical protein
MNKKTSQSYIVNLLFLISLNILTYSILSCDIKESDKVSGSYVKPSVNYKGQKRKGYFRKKVSTSKNSLKNQNRSRYYYHTRGKYRRKNK